MPLLVLVRHGQSAWNLENRFTGWVDVPLTDEGRAEARAAAAKIAGMKLDEAHTSALVRAQETLRIIQTRAGLDGLPVHADAALNERHYGDLQGQDKAETARRYGERQVHLWRRSYDVPPPGGESLRDTAARTLPYYDTRIAPRLRGGGGQLVVAHGNSLRSIVMKLDGLSREEVLALEIPTGVPIVYEMSPELSVVSKRVL